MGKEPGRLVGNISADDLELVGFNGVPSVECGRALPVARKKSNDTFFLIATGSVQESYATYSRIEIGAFVREGRLTLFKDPLPIPGSVLVSPGETPRQPLVIWAARDLLSALGTRLPRESETGPLTWQEQFGSQPRWWFACASAYDVEQVLNLWGLDLVEKANSSLRDNSDWTSIMRFADMGLCAAIDSRIRYLLYTRYAASQAISPEPERASRTYDRFVCKEFSSCTWQQFSTDFRRLLQTLWGVGVNKPEFASDTHENIIPFPSPNRLERGDLTPQPGYKRTLIPLDRA